MTPFPSKHLTVGGEDPFLPSLLAAINQATQISITSAFIRLTGLHLIKDSLTDALERKASVRILTGDYLSITDPHALRLLMLLKEAGAEARVFESGGIHSFHMKAYLFHYCRHGILEDGCAFVGSSNITKSALEHGLEWNLRVGLMEDESRFQQICMEFDKVFDDPRSKNLTHLWIDDYIRRRPDESLPLISEPGADEIAEVPTPNSIQSQALTALSRTRDKGFRRGLVVMATGLGKTWLAAFDCKAMNAQRILFVAHREEILDQAEQTFVRIMPDAKVGKYNGKEHELNVDMLFASVQTLGKAHHLRNFRSDYFDYIVVDEFHHAAARTYQKLLSHFQPRFLVGLTATPDRTDQSDILNLCDDNLVFSEDLFEGIKAKLLCPFHYYGIGDETVDYQEIRWRNGKFDPDQLMNQLATNARARHNLEQWRIYCQKRTLAFCISKKHADFMADYFNKNGVKAVSVHSESEIRRNEALTMLKRGEIDVLFSVDLFNEGVDLPSVDTVLMLRPTESKIVFLQQLGRGLRTDVSSGKEKLIVLDFIGNHTSFFRKPEALFKIGVTNAARKSFLKQAKDDALPLPEGCFVNYDLTAFNFMKALTASRVNLQEEIYDSLKESFGRRPSLAEFYNAGGAVETIRREHGHWLKFVDTKKDLTGPEQHCLEKHSDFLLELEVTIATKSFKLILLESMVELEGFEIPPSLEKLAEKSFQILQRRRILLNDLPDEYRGESELSESNVGAWAKYWEQNPINAWIGGNRPNARAYFEVENERFRFVQDVSTGHFDTFMVLVEEINNYRYLRYEARLANKGIDQPLGNVGLTAEDDQRNIIPYFSDLKIACGHFARSDHDTENIELRRLPDRYGQLDISRCFVAQAKGDSMNGGDVPIKDGDYMLLEAITPIAEEIPIDQIVAIEQQNVTHGDQFLLRRAFVNENGESALAALNSSYETQALNERMNVFALFKEIIKPPDMLIHQAVFKQDASQWFGIEYKEGVWKMPGHITPKETVDHFLFVNLNKRGAAKDYKYHDFFENASNFHWQSQKTTTPKSDKGKNLINHEANGGDIHLFVRKHAKIKGKAAPFIFCGKVIYKSHSGSAPMDVKFRMETPLSPALLTYFKDD